MEKDTETKEKMRTRDWKWIVSVLIAIIICLFTAIFLNNPEKISISDVISIGSGLVSIALAIVAIIMAVAEGIKSSNKEEKVQVGLDKIITNTNTMRDLIHRLEKEVLNTRTEVKSFRQDYIESAKTFRMPNENVQEFKDPQTSQPTTTDQIEGAIDKEQANPKAQVNNQSKQHPTHTLRRGDIYFANLSPVAGSEQGGVRPVLVVSNDIANRFSPVITVAPITAQIQKAKLPTHIEIDAKRWGFERDSVILAEQIKSIDRKRLTDKITHLDENMMDTVDNALSVQLGLIDF